MQFEIRDFHVPCVDRNGKIMKDESGKPIPMTRDQLNLMVDGMLAGYILKIPKVFSAVAYYPEPVQALILKHIEQEMGSTGWVYNSIPDPRQSVLEHESDDDEDEDDTELYEYEEGEEV